MELNFENPCPGQANGLPAYYFTQVVQMLIATHCTIGNPNDYPKDFGNSFKNNDEFDFVIIGGGSSGSVIANRLSEIHEWKILLIESGGDPTFESDIPSFSLSLPGRDLDWKHETNQTKNACLGMEDEKCAIFQGRVLGGTSTINKMHYFRGNPEDYNAWKKLGNDDWGYEDVLKYFKKSEKLDEDFNITSETEFEKTFDKLKKSTSDDAKLYEQSKIAVGKYHSKGGLFSVNHFSYDFYLSNIKKAIFDGAEELKIKHIGDVNGPTQTGYARILGTIIDGNRGNTAKAFLSPIKKRKNLFVLKNATVQQLVFENDVVVGVKFRKNDTLYSVKANKEVILAAGAINSPRLLLVSGVGPIEQLKKLGIQIVKNLPGVGENLQAHLTFFGFPISLKGVSKSVTHLQKIDAMYRFISRGTGYFGNIGLNDIVGFISTKNESSPDIQLLHYLNHLRDYYTFNELLISVKIKNEIRDQFAKAYAKSAVLLICPTLLQPKSRGKIELDSPRFHNPPKIFPNFLTNEDDIKTLIKGIRSGFDLIQSNAFKALEPVVLKLEVHGCKHLIFNTDEYWECLIKHLTTSMHDVAGTCKMGPTSDKYAVVDSSLKVYGIKGLRVADSSIMPLIVRGSTSVASVMIGEKVSDMIKKEYKKLKHDEL